MSERLKFEGRLREKEREAAALKLRIEGLRDSMRSQLDPFEKIEDLKAYLIAGQGVDLSEYYNMYLEALEDIQKLKKELGIKP